MYFFLKENIMFYLELLMFIQPVLAMDVPKMLPEKNVEQAPRASRPMPLPAVPVDINVRRLLVMLNTPRANRQAIGDLNSDR